MLQQLKNLLPTRRKIIQLYFALLFNANLKGFTAGTIYSGSAKQFCVPGLNCYSCPGAVGACPLGSLQGAFSAGHSTLYYVGGILLLYSILFGRMICGWLCPFGLIQELLYKIPTPKWKKGSFTRILSTLKYGILVLFVFVIPVFYAIKDIPMPAFCKYICPAGTLEGGLALLANKVNEGYFAMLGPIFTWKFLLTVSLLTLCVFAFRLFCRFLCPLGALYGLFNRFSFFGVTVARDKCVDCNLCITDCKLDIRHVGDRECISCGECIPACPTQAIQWKGGTLGVKKNDIPEEAPVPKPRSVLRLLTALVPAAFLAFALLYFAGQSPGAQPEYGVEPGSLCYGYELQALDSQGITGETFDPAKTGKITVINFWGTWCTPCLRELPAFDRIAREYADSVTVVAVHSALSGETAAEYIGTYYPDSPIRFAVDDPLEESGLTSGYYTALGGRGTWPYTVILDENGVIAAVFVTPLDYESLKAAVEAALQP